LASGEEVGDGVHGLEEFIDGVVGLSQNKQCEQDDEVIVVYIVLFHHSTIKYKYYTIIILL